MGSREHNMSVAKPPTSIFETSVISDAPIRYVNYGDKLLIPFVHDLTEYKNN